MAGRWFEVMPAEDLWIGEMIGVDLSGVSVLLLNYEDEVQAFLDRCPHRSSKLSEGDFEGPSRRIVCATHLWEFDALSGHGINPEGTQLVRFGVRLEGGSIYVEVPELGDIPEPQPDADAGDGG
jgi:toluene monooxygenase system ferredoxin subunit